MARRASTLFVALGVVLTVAAGVEATGLRTPFLEVNLGCLKPGQTYSLLENRNLPLSVTNTGKVPVDLAIDVLRPRMDELFDGYEPISDTNWITLQQNRFRLEPGTNAITDVLVNVPEDKRYLGRRYQLWLFSYVLRPGGVVVGLKSRVLFTICEE
jgi:hypothetical protein